ncbi:MAG: hypothetical protein P4M11_10230 [Candidatus Pacebacteria bacterium]|nr:hypothetical protein [Candidatus Paceibacterota bacterium]
MTRGVEKSLKGEVVKSSSQEDIIDDEERDESVDIIVNNISNTVSSKRKYRPRQCRLRLRLDEATYMTSLGTVSGTLLVSQYFLIFDPNFTKENAELIPVTSRTRVL